MAPIRLLSKTRLQRGSTYLVPYVCFACSKSFRKSPAEATRACPQCAGPMIMLNRKFSAPRKRDAEQWTKGRRLVEHGFYFFSVYRVGENGKKLQVPYPARLSEVSDFVTEFREQSALFRRKRTRESKAPSTLRSDA